jgi:hypothetical protein
MVGDEREESDAIFERYQSWLIDRGVELTDGLMQVRSPLRKGEKGDKIPEALRREWGLMSRGKAIPKGKVVCRVPKAACFMGDTTVRVELTESDDSQLPLAVALLKAMDEGPSGENWPKIQTLPSTVGVCWAWDKSERKWLEGTELEDIMERKRQRLKTEHAELQARGFQWSFEAYHDACSVVISHANPWFGVCMVPFVDMGNHADRPDVEFRERAGRIIGTALRTIPPNAEVFQSYGDLGVADLLYRYGFARHGPAALAPRLADAASIRARDLPALLGLPDAAFREPDSVAARIDHLRVAGVVSESPWDGAADVLLVALSLPDGPAGRVDGLAELLAAVHALLLDAPRWAAALHVAKAARPLLAGRLLGTDDADAAALLLGLDSAAAAATAAAAGSAAGEPENDLERRVEALLDRIGPAATVRAGAGAAAGGSDGCESESDDEDEEGLDWGDLIGPAGELSPWAAAADVRAAAQRALRAREGLYPADRPAGGGGGGGGGRSMSARPTKVLGTSLP